MIKQTIIVVGSLLAGAWLQEKYDVLGKTTEASKKIISEAKKFVATTPKVQEDNGPSNDESE